MRNQQRSKGCGGASKRIAHRPRRQPALVGRSANGGNMGMGLSEHRWFSGSLQQWSSRTLSFFLPPSLFLRPLRRLPMPRRLRDRLEVESERLMLNESSWKCRPGVREGILTAGRRRVRRTGLWMGWLRRRPSASDSIWNQPNVRGELFQLRRRGRGGSGSGQDGSTGRGFKIIKLDRPSQLLKGKGHAAHAFVRGQAAGVIPGLFWWEEGGS